MGTMAWSIQRLHDAPHLRHLQAGPVSDALAVVDQYGHVYGLTGLRVMDASILPDCPCANTNVVTMMLGERIADGIRQGL
jgi:5-(hydroxymethyl)furfural/furfural oxidase